MNGGILAVPLFRGEGSTGNEVPRHDRIRDCPGETAQAGIRLRYPYQRLPLEESVFIQKTRHKQYFRNACGHTSEAQRPL